MSNLNFNIYQLNTEAYTKLTAPTHTLYFCRPRQFWPNIVALQAGPNVGLQWPG
jgi:hypothetical protein